MVADQLFGKSIYADFANLIFQCVLRNRSLKKLCARINLLSSLCSYIASHLVLLLERWMVCFVIREKWILYVGITMKKWKFK